MTATTLRHYRVTLANNSTRSERRIREMKKRLRTRISRRRFKKSVQRTLGRLYLI